MIDDAAGWIVDWVSTRTADDWRRYAWFTAVLIIAYAVVQWIVRRFVPWLIARLIIPAGAGVVLATCTVLMVGQGVLALLLRALGMRPPGLVFALGDGIGAAGRGTRSAVPRLADGMYFLRRTPRLVIWALLAGILWAGHEVTCAEEPDSLWCRRPLSAVTALGGDLWQIGADLVGAQSSP